MGRKSKQQLEAEHRELVRINNELVDARNDLLRTIFSTLRLHAKNNSSELPRTLGLSNGTLSYLVKLSGARITDMPKLIESGDVAAGNLPLYTKESCDACKKFLYDVNSVWLMFKRQEEAEYNENGSPNYISNDGRCVGKQVEKLVSKYRREMGVDIVMESLRDGVPAEDAIA